MEFLFEILIRLLFEFIFQVLGEGLFEFLFRRRVDSLAQRSEDRQLARLSLFYMVFGALMGLASAYIFPVGVYPTPETRVINLIFAPVLLAFMMHSIRPALNLHTGIPGKTYLICVLLFGYCFSGVRFFMVH